MKVGNRVRFRTNNNWEGVIIEVTRSTVRVRWNETETTGTFTRKDAKLDLEVLPSELATKFPTGRRVELSPSTDQWMMGDRYGDVAKVDDERGLVHVKMDRSGRTLKCKPEHILDKQL